MAPLRRPVWVEATRWIRRSVYYVAHPRVRAAVARDQALYRMVDRHIFDDRCPATGTDAAASRRAFPLEEGWRQIYVSARSPRVKKCLKEVLVGPAIGVIAAPGAPYGIVCVWSGVGNSEIGSIPAVLYFYIDFPWQPRGRDNAVTPINREIEHTPVIAVRQYVGELQCLSKRSIRHDGRSVAGGSIEPVPPPVEVQDVKCQLDGVPATEADAPQLVT